MLLISWDEINLEAIESDLDVDLPVTCTDDELVAAVRKNNGDVEDPEVAGGTDWLGRPNTWGWRCAAVTRGPNTATIEWRSDRDHLATSLIIWERD